MKVIVNPNYGGNGWFDTAAKISFVKGKEYKVTEDMNLVHVKKHLALGYLLEVTKKEDIETEEISPIVTSSARELLEEPVQETIQEVIVEENTQEIKETTECILDETLEEKEEPKKKSKAKSKSSKKADTEKQ